MKRTWTTVLVCGVLAAGCGGEDEQAPAPASSGDTVEVGMKNIEFMPKVVDVRVGQTVRWTNGEPIVHNVTAEEGADFRSDNLQEGQTFSWKADEAGVVQYVCTIHPGQTGTLRVR